jgi:hypothetical protein
MDYNEMIAVMASQIHASQFVMSPPSAFSDAAKEVMRNQAVEEAMALWDAVVKRLSLR